jgi:hypothetical protein
MDAVSFYCNNFDAVKSVVDSFNPADAISISRGQQAFNKTTVGQQLAYIQSNFSILSTSIKKLETQVPANSIYSINL